MTTTQRFVNDVGIEALKYLARTEPQIFLVADPKSLIARMEKVAGTGDVWGPVLDLHSDLTSLAGC